MPRITVKWTASSELVQRLDHIYLIVVKAFFSTFIVCIPDYTPHDASWWYFVQNT